MNRRCPSFMKKQVSLLERKISQVVSTGPGENTAFLQLIDCRWKVEVIAGENHRSTSPLNTEANTRNGVEAVCEVKRGSLESEWSTDDCRLVAMAMP
mmetsp:Transcript_31615/g.52179  ORF Transcript_31615/g.52179 Transcript_31615/m.52179 type:complete len:97 (-) Transcript_31615:2392-2682(-)